jgi:UDP-N-acetylglucosamine acyltransferase
VPNIHPTAVVDPGAKLADDVTVGPLAVIGSEVELGAGVEIGPHVFIAGRTRIGARTRVYPFAVLGPDAAGARIRRPRRRARDRRGQRDPRARVDPRRLPVHGGITSLGNHNLIQNGFHIAHDCRIGNYCVLAGMSGFAGHCIIEDFAVVGAMSGLHQFVRVGESAFTAGNSMVSKDVPPFAKVAATARASSASTRSISSGAASTASGSPRSSTPIISCSSRRLPFESACERVEAECGDSRDVRHLLSSCARPNADSSGNRCRALEPRCSG